MKKNKYVIVTPRMDNGGCIVLHTLCKLLSELGQDAKVFYIGDFMYKDGRHFKFWINWVIFQIKVTIKNLIVLLFGDNANGFKLNLPKAKYRRKFLPFVSKNTIVVYPDIIFGNPLHAKKVVRWMLSYNQYYKQEGGKTIGYDKNDLFFFFRDVFHNESLSLENRKLYLTYFDLELYKKTNYGERSGKCYILRKGAWRVDDRSILDGPVIDDLPEKEKVRLFNDCEYCISYDTQTSYSQIAAMCGCVSVIIPEKGKTKKDYLKNDDVDYGVSFSFLENDLDYAKKTSEKLIEIYKDTNESAKISVMKFVFECREYFFKN